MTPTDIRNWQVDINNPLAIVEGAKDIMQCIYVILTTIPGSDPLRPTFGSNVYQYIDMPVNVAQPRLIYEATEAIKRWEKRVEVTRCTLQTNTENRRTLMVEATVIASAQQITIPITL